tara:strand:+ start:352 stop:1242 length:891 start_codon:yes stop_codon:yes gene_type:complete
MSQINSKVEAVLFLSGRMLSIEEIRKFCRTNEDRVKEALKEIKEEYEKKNSGIRLLNDGDKWKFAVEDEYIPIARKIGTETELTKSVLETLAVIAFKYPVLQAEVIKIRTNKAYKHMEELVNAGFITRLKHGRTNIIKLTDKFFNYFDLPPEKLKDKFRDFQGLAQAISEKEQSNEDIKEKRQKDAEELKDQDEKIKQEIEELDKSDEDYKVPVEVYEGEKKEEEGSKEKLGDLEVVDEVEKSEDDSGEEESSEEESGEEEVESGEETGEEESGEGKEDSKVDEAVERMMNPDKEE